MFSLFHTRACCTLALSISLSGLAQANFTEVISFGDSLSDVGNLYFNSGGAIPTSPPYDDGRFSNGPVGVEVIATSLGLTPATYSQDIGSSNNNNYAWGGARTTIANFPPIPPSVQQQVTEYLAKTTNIADPNALYTILIGGNDLVAHDGGFDPINCLTCIYGDDELIADAQEVANFANSLLAAGAQNILVINVPDLGSVPRYNFDGAESAHRTALTQLFNDNLETGLNNLNSPYVTLFDAFSISQDMVTNPSNYGLTNVTDQCLSPDESTICANPNEYMFWDDLHPTARAHQIIGAQAAAAVVPVPAAAWLFGSALVGLSVYRRKHG